MTLVFTMYGVARARRIGDRPLIDAPTASSPIVRNAHVHRTATWSEATVISLEADVVHSSVAVALALGSQLRSAGADSRSIWAATVRARAHRFVLRYAHDCDSDIVTVERSSVAGRVDRWLALGDVRPMCRWEDQADPLVA